MAEGTWYISATLRKQFPNLTKKFILSLGTVLPAHFSASLYIMLHKCRNLESAEHVAEGLVRGLRDVNADVDVGDGGGEAHDHPHGVHHPRRRRERQQEP